MGVEDLQTTDDELEVNEEEDGFFAEAAGNEPTEKEEDDGEEETENEANDGDDSEAEEGEKEEVEESAEDRAERLAMEGEKKEEPEGPIKSSLTHEQLLEAARILGVDPSRTQEPAKRPALQKESVKWIADALTEDDLPDEEIKIGDTKINLREYAKDLPETFTATKVMAGAIAAQIINSMKASGQLVSGDEVQKIRAEMVQMATDQAYWSSILAKHPDARVIAKDDAFNKWLDSKGPKWVAMAQQYDADKAIAILDAYKESQAKAKTAEFDKAAKAKKARTDAIHGNSLRGKQKIGSGAKDADLDDEGLFNAAVAELSGK